MVEVGGKLPPTSIHRLYAVNLFLGEGCLAIGGGLSWGYGC